MKQILATSLIIILLACNKATDTHQCRWPLCPYKGIEISKASQAIADYIGDTAAIEGYNIAMLHIQYPTYEYDQLDSLLTH